MAVFAQSAANREQNRQESKATTKENPSNNNREKPGQDGFGRGLGGLGGGFEGCCRGRVWDSGLHAGFKASGARRTWLLGSSMV